LPSLGKDSARGKSKSPDNKEVKKGSNKVAKGDSGSKGGKKNRKEEQMIGGPSYRTEDVDDDDAISVSIIVKESF